MKYIYTPLFLFAILCSIFFTGFIPKCCSNNSEGYFWNNLSYYIFRPVAYIFPHFEQRKIIYKEDSKHFSIQVELDEEGRRHLVFLPRTGSQSIYDPANPTKMISSFMNHAMLALPALGRPPGKVLFLGLGGGIMPMFIRRYFPDAQIDSVEIDQSVFKIAEKYFGFKPDPKMNIFISDGRKYVDRATQKYDIIFLDVYDAEEIPVQFTTIEFFSQLKKCLSDGGVVVANLANLGKEGFMPEELNTIFHVFKNTFVFVCPGSTNYVPVAMSNNNTTFTDLRKNAVFLDKQKRYDINFEELLKSVLKGKKLDDLMGPTLEIFRD